MTVLDTSFLVAALTDTGAAAHTALRRAFAGGERFMLPTLVLYEWLRGPRTEDELGMQEALLPAAKAEPFTDDDAAVAARLYRALPRARERELDLAVAACAVTREARLWTLNIKDFVDVPGLDLVSDS